MAYSSIVKPEDYFNIVLWTGNGSTQSITGVGFQPDWVWAKERGGANSHMWADSVRGATKMLFSNLNNAEDTDANSITSFDSDGFGIGSSGNLNASSDTYIGWNWLAGGTASSNTDGSITSSVSANTTAGFSIVKWTGTGANATVGHGLGAVPKMIITKAIVSSNWGVYHESLGNTDAIFLNETTATGSSSVYWNNTSPTSSVFSLGSGGTNGGSTNNTGGMIAYCFAEKKGYSKFGSYVPNGGGSDNTFVYTGFKPKWIMAKGSSFASAWTMTDSSRSTFNVLNSQLFAHTNAAEDNSSTNLMCDYLSNGFKMRSDNAAMGSSGQTYIYMAFAENPFVANNSGTAVPVTAR